MKNSVLAGQIDLFDYLKTLNERLLSFTWDHRDGQCYFHKHDGIYNYYWTDHEMRYNTTKYIDEINDKCFINNCRIYVVSRETWKELREWNSTRYTMAIVWN